MTHLTPMPHPISLAPRLFVIPINRLVTPRAPIFKKTKIERARVHDKPRLLALSLSCSRARNVYHRRHFSFARPHPFPTSLRCVIRQLATARGYTRERENRALIPRIILRLVSDFRIDAF